MGTSSSSSRKKSQSKLPILPLSLDWLFSSAIDEFLYNLRKHSFFKQNIKVRAVSEKHANYEMDFLTPNGTLANVNWPELVGCGRFNLFNLDGIVKISNGLESMIITYKRGIKHGKVSLNTIKDGMKCFRESYYVNGIPEGIFRRYQNDMLVKETSVSGHYTREDKNTKIVLPYVYLNGLCLKWDPPNDLNVNTVKVKAKAETKAKTKCRSQIYGNYLNYGGSFKIYYSEKCCKYGPYYVLNPYQTTVKYSICNNPVTPKEWDGFIREYFSEIQKCTKLNRDLVNIVVSYRWFVGVSVLSFISKLVSDLSLC